MEAFELMIDKKTIKIFVDAHVFDGGYQGSRTFIKELYNVLIKKENLQIYIGAYNINNAKQHFLNAENVFFIQYQSRSSWIRLAVDIPRIIRKNEIDYAHFQYMVPINKSCRFIVTTHDVIFRDFPGEFSFFYTKSKQWLYKQGAKRADILTTVSNYSKQSINKYLSIPEYKINVIPNAVSDNFFSAYDKGEAKKYIREKYGVNKFILLVSRIEPRKNHSLLLKSYLDLKLYSKGYHLFFAGERTLPVAEMDKQLENLPGNIKQFIVISNNVDSTDLLKLYQAADVFVYPSKAEGFGIPPLEAAAAGTPVLCSNSSAMKEFCFFDDQLFDPTDEDELKRKLAKIIETVPAQYQLDKIAEEIRDTYSWQKSADKLYELIINDHQMNMQ
jgi:glycosyltransferase involved in cell wall biosynthesis